MPPIPSEQCSPYPKILLEPEVLALVRLSAVSVWRLERRGAFPRLIKLTGKRVAWLEHEVLDWISARMAARAA
jgi:prophage regulatory protein